MLIWPQNAQNLISEDLNLKNFTGEDFPGAGISAVRISNTLLWSPVSGPGRDESSTQHNLQDVHVYLLEQQCASLPKKCEKFYYFTV